MLVRFITYLFLDVLLERRAAENDAGRVAEKYCRSSADGARWLPMDETVM